MLYIPTNMTPSEAVNQFEELQVHPAISDWAEDSMILDRLTENEIPKILALVEKMKVEGENAVLKGKIIAMLEEL